MSSESSYVEYHPTDIDINKGLEIAAYVKKNFHGLHFTIYIEKNFMDYVIFMGTAPGYRFSIRVKRVDFDRCSAKVLAETYIDTLKMRQKDKENKLEQR